MTPEEKEHREAIINAALLRMEIERDKAEWPDGHPCRDCGRLYKQHSTFDLNCNGWR